MSQTESNPTRSVPLQGGPLTIEGAISIEETDAGLHPWRIPVAEQDLFETSPTNKASMPAGIRLTLISDTSSVRLDVVPPPVESDPPWVFDLLVDGKLHGRIPPAIDADTIQFDHIPAGEHRLELYLPSQYVPVVLRGLYIDEGATASSWTDDRKRIVFYGSSITHCRHAAGPSETWPAIVANRADLHLTSLGLGGDCHLDPMFARLIHDLPADAIGLKLGINMMGGTVSDRTFRAFVIGFIKTIRDGHPNTPIAVVSPICHPPRESTPNEVGMTLQIMRQRLAEAVDVLQGHGDQNLHYVDGLSLMGENNVHLYIDGIHPSAEGYRFLADAYLRETMPKLGL